MRTKTLIPLAALSLGFAASAQAVVPTGQVDELSRYYGVDWMLGGAGQMRDYPNVNGDPQRQIALNNANAVSGASIARAYLYFGGPSDNPSASGLANITFNGTPVTGTGLGVEFPNFDEYNYYHGYRADVTSLLAGGFGANATFNLENQYNYGGGDVNVSGASLMIIYNDGNASNNRDLILFDGNDSNGYDGWWGTSLFGVPYAGGQANMYLGVGDGDIVYEDGQLLLNGNYLFPNEFDGSILGNPPAGNDVFWDIAGYDISALLNPGLNDLYLTSFLQTDYDSLIHGFIDLPAFEQPVPEPATVISGLAFAGLAASRLLRRKK